MELIQLGIITPNNIIVGLVIYLVLVGSALYFVLKNEVKFVMFLWIALVLMLPFLGALIYLVKYFIGKKRLENKSLV
jgi:membrane protein implicated in regulation of membrane protease activity